MLSREERPDLFAEFALGEPRPWKATYQGLEYSGEVLVTDTFHPGLGEIAEEGVQFRIVVFTGPQEIPEGAIADPRIAFCLPATPTAGLRRLEREYRVVRERGVVYEAQGLRSRLLEEQAKLYGAGRLLTRGRLPIDLAQVFSLPDNAQRFALIASALLAQPCVSLVWKDLFPYACLIEEGLKAATEPEEIAAQEAILVSKLSELGEALEEVGRSLEQLRAALKSPPGKEVLQALGRLSRLAGTRSYLDFQARVQGNYAAPDALGRDIDLYRNLCQLSQAFPEIVATKSYLEGVVLREADVELAMDRVSILEQLNLRDLLPNPQLWASIKALFDWFRSRYHSVYQAHHRDYSRLLASLHARLVAARLQLEALGRLNSLAELGGPLGQDLFPAYEELLERTKACPGEPRLEAEPLCPRCSLLLTDDPPIEEVERFLEGLAQALREQHRRLSTETIRQILAQSKESKVDQFVKVIQTADLSSLANVMDDELVDFLRKLLLEASTRPFPILKELREKHPSLGEEQIEEVAAEFASRLREAFAQAKREAPGKRFRIAME